MASMKYPIGIQSFQKLIEGDFPYIDKTGFIGRLVKEGQYIFLSRPRRFGKSLLLSTIHAYFDGRRDLFKGLAIDSMDMDWKPYPVLHFDFNSGLFKQPDGLLNRIRKQLSDFECLFDLTPREDLDAALRFESLIQGIHCKTGRQVVILVDEYDKPLLGLEEDSELYDNNQRLLKAFFSNLKSMDQHIQFAMLSGVARFSKVSIFSDLNNLKDISMFEQYQEICGWTEEELKSGFMPGIDALAQRRKESPSETLDELRRYYDGYLFSEEGTRLYNPYSVMMALDGKFIKPYWFDTGTPSFLAERIKKSGIKPESLNGLTINYENLIAVGVGSGNISSLLYHTGYLTIESYDFKRMRYTLGFPNREVEIGFAQNLLPLYAPSTTRPNSPFNLQRFQDDLYDGKPEAFMERLGTLIKNIPYDDQDEATFRTVAYLLCLLSGTEAIPERHSYMGRSDLEVLTPDYIYVFEFKYNKSVGEAIDQIKDRDYAGRFALDSRRLFLIGANFTDTNGSRSLEFEII